MGLPLEVIAFNTADLSAAARKSLSKIPVAAKLTSLPSLPAAATFLGSLSISCLPKVLANSPFFVGPRILMGLPLLPISVLLVYILPRGKTLPTFNPILDNDCIIAFLSPKALAVATSNLSPLLSSCLPKGVKSFAVAPRTLFGSFQLKKPSLIIVPSKSYKGFAKLGINPEAAKPAFSRAFLLVMSPDLISIPIPPKPIASLGVNKP